jgi:spore coat polysaccharide biosynthesis protein SpsF (cytidylyltransferase family)
LPPLEWQHPEVKISVDTQDDYERINRLYHALYQNTNVINPTFGKTIISCYKELFK